MTFDMYKYMCVSWYIWKYTYMYLYTQKHLYSAIHRVYHSVESLCLIVTLWKQVSLVAAFLDHFPSKPNCTHRSSNWSTYEADWWSGDWYGCYVSHTHVFMNHVQISSKWGHATSRNTTTPRPPPPAPITAFDLLVRVFSVAITLSIRSLMTMTLNW